MAKRRQMSLGLSIGNIGYHNAAWRHPDVPADGAMRFDHYRRCAALAEEGRFDLIFLDDTAAVRAVDSAGMARVREHEQVKHEPFALLAAVSAITSRVGLVPTVPTTYTDPYNIARAVGTLDHLSGGRAGWNPVTGFSVEEARNYGLDAVPADADQHGRAIEFIEVVTGLFNSWDDDAVPRDKSTGIFFDRSKMHVLDHRGRYFKVLGPLDLPPLPQRHPPISTAATSDASQEFAARVADVVYAELPTLEGARNYYASVKGRLARYGRSPDEMKIVPGIMTYVGRTRQEARDKFERMQSLLTPEHGLDCWDFCAVGTATDIADVMEEWFVTGAADGFNLRPPGMPISAQDFVALVIPELQRRDLFRREYADGTLRERLGLPRAVPRSIRDR